MNVALNLITIFAIVADAAFAGCPLKWVPTGNGSYPDNSVSAAPNQYVVRALSQRSTYIPGRLEPPNTYAFVANAGQKLYRTYEVLTNPYGCLLKWLYACCGRVPESRHAIGGDSEYEKRAYVGREYEESTGLPGWVVSRAGRLYYTREGIEYWSNNYEILVAKGVAMTVSHFQHKSLPAIGDYVVDELIGKSELNSENQSLAVKRGVTHRKFVERRTRFKFGRSWPHVISLKIAANTPMGVFERLYDYQSANMSGTEFADSWREFVEISRELEISPNKSVTVSSYATVCRDYPIDFVATCKFVGDGLDGHQIMDAIGGDLKSSVINVTNNALFAEIKGRFIVDWIVGKNVTVEETVVKVTDTPTVTPTDTTVTPNVTNAETPDPKKIKRAMVTNHVMIFTAISVSILVILFLLFVYLVFDRK